MCGPPAPRGWSRKIIVNRHALKNALLPVVTVIGIEFAFLMGGLVVTEQVFNLNGLGRLLVDSVTFNDYTMTQGIVMTIVLVFVLTNLRHRSPLRVARSAHPLQLRYLPWRPQISTGLEKDVLPPAPTRLAKDHGTSRASSRWGRRGCCWSWSSSLMALFADVMTAYDPELGRVL